MIARGADPWDHHAGESVDHPDKLWSLLSSNAAHILSSFSVGMNPSGSLVRVRFASPSIRFTHTNTKCRCKSSVLTASLGLILSFVCDVLLVFLAASDDSGHALDSRVHSIFVTNRLEAHSSARATVAPPPAIPASRCQHHLKAQSYGGGGRRKIHAVWNGRGRVVCVGLGVLLWTIVANHLGCRAGWSH